MYFTSSFLRGVEEVNDKDSVLSAANNHMIWSLTSISIEVSAREVSVDKGKP